MTSGYCPQARRARGTLVTGRNRPRARRGAETLVRGRNRPRARRARGTLVTGRNRPRARRARGTLVTGRNRPRARRARGTLVTGLARWTLVTSGNRPRATCAGDACERPKQARGTLVTGRNRPRETAPERDWRRGVGFALLIWKQPRSTLKMFMLSTLGQTNIRTADPGLRRLCLRLVSDRRQTHQVTEACPHRAPFLPHTGPEQTPMCF